MPHVALVSFVGLRVREAELLALGMRMPGLAARGAAIGRLPALGLLTLAGMTPPHWSCTFHETDDGIDAAAEEIIAARPTLVALSALTASVDAAYAFSTRLRAAGIRTVMGGLHVTACPEEASQFADAVVVGDGEPLWPQVLADAESGSLRRIYRADKPFDMAAAPVPKFELLGAPVRRRYTLQTQRGCPFACDFCAASRVLGPFREKPAANILAELQALGRIAPNPDLELADDNTFAGGRDAGPMLDALAAAGARWFTEADWRLGERPEIVRRLAAAGCVQVLVGFESMVFRHAGMGAKSADPARVLDAVGRLQDAGVAVNGCFILGSDGETPESMDRLVEFINSSPLAEVQITLPTPFPGTMLRRRLEREGRLLPDRGRAHLTLFDVAFRPDRMTVEQLESGFRDVVRRVYSPEVEQRRSDIRKAVWRRKSLR